MRHFAQIGLVAATILIATWPASAQERDPQLEITAQDMLEWRRGENAMIAQGKVVVTRGTLRLQAENVSAYYRDAKSGGAGEKQEVYRVDASGGVRIDTDGARAFGASAAYDLDQAVFVLTGGSPRFEANNLTVTAAQNLEYWQDRRLAVARGDAVALSGDRRIAADVLSAYVDEDSEGETTLRKVEAFGAVVVSTPDEQASGERAVYDAASAMVTLCGEVAIRRGGNEIKGDCAEVDLNSGVSRLIGGGGGIRGLAAPPE